MTISTNYANFLRYSAYSAKARGRSSTMNQTNQVGGTAALIKSPVRSSVETRASFQPVMSQGVQSVNSQVAPQANSLSPIRTTSTHAATIPAGETLTPTIAPSGRIVISMALPGPPDQQLPPVRYNSSATRIFDPATGTYAPPGYESWAQRHADLAAIKERGFAMYEYFQTINAIIEKVTALAQQPPQTDPDQTPPQAS